MDEEHREEEGERPRPRVVDKRVSARPAPEDVPAGGAVPRAQETEQEQVPPEGSTPPDSASRTTAPTESTPSSARAAAPTETPGVPSAASGAQEEGSEQGDVWTPEREERARQVAQQIAETPALEWVVNVAVTLANVAGTKIDMGQAADARLAIEALAGLLDRLGADLGEAETPLRSTLAQLQMAYAQAATQPPPDQK